MQRTIIMAGALALALAGAALALAPARQLTPHWNVGDTWSLRTEYRQIAHRDGHDQLSWSRPVTFRYTVTGRTEQGGRIATVIQAVPSTADTGFTTELTLAAEAGKLSLAGVRTVHRRQGRTVTERKAYPAPMPVFTESSIIPYDVPVFPLTQGAALDASHFLEARKTFTRVEEAGGIKFARVSSQLVKPAGLSSFVDAQARTVDFAVPLEASRVFPVELACQSTGQRVIQYWAEGLPWAAYSENASSRSWLVKP